jgi:tRNA modification GTPase
MVPSDISVIVALATPAGEGAIAVVRMSGDGALEIADRVFRGAHRLREADGYTVHHGSLVTPAGEMVDEVLALVFRGPHSYTGEDAVEFSCHGGMLVTQEVIKALLKAGARQAEPGEFTRRAFMNGRIDLSQAEAVADLIAARSERARVQSLQQLEGRLGHRVGGLRKSLVELCALLELELDFSEEGIDLVGRGEVAQKIGDVKQQIVSMMGTYEAGRIDREGVLVVLAGSPNVGKSSLFNALLGEARAIVASAPGTTRDSIEESLVINGILFRLVDTAGLRRPVDPVEAEGVDRTKHQVRYADVVLLVEDLLADLKEKEIEEALHGLLKDQRLIVILNKVDLVCAESVRSRYEEVTGKGVAVVATSAKSHEGIQELRKSLVGAVTQGRIDSSDGVVVANRRHLDALSDACKSLELAMDGVLERRSNEFIALDIREAAAKLGEITGEVTTQDVLDSIFARFCIGK